MTQKIQITSHARLITYERWKSHLP